MLINPIVEIREQTGLNRAAMARRLGLNYDSLAKVELGYMEQLTPKVLKALEQAGYDTASLQARYIQWRVSGCEGATAEAAAE